MSHRNMHKQAFDLLRLTCAYIRWVWSLNDPYSPYLSSSNGTTAIKINIIAANIK